MGPHQRTLSGHTDWITAVAVTPDGQRALSVGDNTIKLRDLESGACFPNFTCDSAAYCCAFSDGGKLIVADDAGGHLHFLRLVEPRPKL